MFVLFIPSARPRARAREERMKGEGGRKKVRKSQWMDDGRGKREEAR